MPGLRPGQQDQAPDKAKPWVQGRRFNAGHDLSDLLWPEDPSSEQAFWGGYCCMSNHLLEFPTHIYTRRAEKGWYSGVFGCPKGRVSVVIPSSNWKEISTATLEAATALFVQQHVRILVDSIQLFLTSRNKEIRKSRYQLACQHYGELNRVRPYTTKEQRKS